MKFFKLLLFCSLFLLSSCSNQNFQQDIGKLSIVATIFPQYDFSRQIAKENANVEMLLPLGTDSHTFEPTPQDIIKITNSDIFIYTGGESDSWIDSILESIDTTNTKIINLSDICEVLYTEDVIHDTVHEMAQDEAHHHTIDEHFWTSPKNAMLICDAINNTLCEIDSENANDYIKNNEEYKKKLTRLDSDLKSIVNNARRKTLIFGDRFPFRYFTNEYGLEYISAFSGCSHDSEPSIQTIKKLIDTVNTQKLPVVFYTDGSNNNITDTIVAETGAKKRLFHSCHNLTKEEFQSGITYLKLMQNNAAVLEEALN